MNTVVTYIFSFWLLLFGWGFNHLPTLNAQSEILAEKKIGFYVSSRKFDFSEHYYIPIAQFLKIEDDRSYTGDIKTELLIRIGEMLTQQFPQISKADTAYFLNGDLRRGQQFIQVYQPDQSRLITGTDNLDGLDYIIILDSMSLKTRSVRSVYIRSNRMIPEKVIVKKANLHISIFDPNQATPIWNLEVCFDERSTPKVEESFDFFNQQSPLGKFISKAFSQWWYQMEDGRPSNCE